MESLQSVEYAPLLKVLWACLIDKIDFMHNPGPDLLIKKHWWKTVDLLKNNAHMWCQCGWHTTQRQVMFLQTLSYSANYYIESDYFLHINVLVWIQVWKNLRLSKWWQNFHFWVNYPLKALWFFCTFATLKKFEKNNMV